MSNGKIIAALAGLAAATGASGSVDTTPAPGGVYRLKPGTYVRKDIPCGSAANSTVQRYDGHGISDPHMRACRVRILSRRGADYLVSQSCVDAGRGQATRSEERQSVTIPDPLTFTLATRGRGTTYRYCPSYMLPSGMRWEPPVRRDQRRVGL